MYRIKTQEEAIVWGQDPGKNQLKKNKEHKA